MCHVDIPALIVLHVILTRHTGKISPLLYDTKHSLPHDPATTICSGYPQSSVSSPFYTPRPISIGMIRWSAQQRAASSLLLFTIDAMCHTDCVQYMTCVRYMT